MDNIFLPTAGNYCVVVPQDAVYTIHEPKEGKILSVELFLQEGAIVTYRTHYVQELHLRITLQADAQFIQQFAHTHTEKRTQLFILQGERASITVAGSYYLKSNEGFFTVLQHHKAAYTKSNLILKTVLAGTANFHYKGTILVEQQAADVVAHQENKNLVVSQQAQAHSIPSLEVLTNKVHCGHGSAVSYIDQEHLFYLATRGIEKDAAMVILIKSFLA